MSDDPRPDGYPELSGAREDSVRRLLAEARHEEPLPPQVAARLDTLLGELVQARSSQTRVGSLAQRRRQRRGVLLVAAAAAVVVGVVGPRLTGDPGGGTASDSSRSGADGASSAESAESSPAQGSRESQELAPEEAPEGGPSSAPAGPAPAAGGVVVLSSATFVADVTRVLGSRGSLEGDSSDLSLTGPACGSATYGAGRLLPAVYDGTSAVLALRPPTDGTQLVEVLACGSAEVLRSTTVPTG
ncbi:MAG: hypothetical protein LH468_06375 [Nocardioides sp.]|nr:hypothetical protein [Nocardioides sp.]